MGTVPIVVATVLGLLLLLLALPVEVMFRLEGIEAFNGQITIRWMLGLVRFRIRIPGASKPPAEPGAATEAVGSRSRPGKRSGRPHLLAVLRQAAFRQRVVRLLRDLLRATHLRRFRLRMRLGLGDPADTGRLWAWMGPLNLSAQQLRGARVQIEADYMEPVFEFQTQGRLLLIPLQFLLLGIGFALSPASLRAWRTLRRAHA
jgi:hypothetical protein